VVSVVLYGLAPDFVLRGVSIGGTEKATLQTHRRMISGTTRENVHGQRSKYQESGSQEAKGGEEAELGRADVPPSAATRQSANRQGQHEAILTPTAASLCAS
jgi:hypothetical protein